MDMSEYLPVFIDEGKEHVLTCYEQLLKLEKDPHNQSIVIEIFRSAHTLKGMAATMGYKDLTTLTHQLENVLDAIRNKKMLVNTNVLDGLFFTVDHLNAIIQSIVSGGNGKRNVSEALNRLKQLEREPAAKGGLLGQEDDSTGSVLETDKMFSSPTIVYDQFELTIIQQSIEQGNEVFEVTVTLAGDCLLKAARVSLIFNTIEKLGEIIKANPPFYQLAEEQFDFTFTIALITKESLNKVHESVMKVSEVSKVEVLTLPNSFREHEVFVQEHDNQNEENMGKETTSCITKHEIHKTIRVKIERLDTLMNLFQELIIHRGRLEQISREIDHQELKEIVDYMTRTSGDMQTVLLNLRMVPISTVFNRFPGMVRQIARDLKKQIQVELVGADTELERSVIDEIGDPLVHILRNAIDHGIETPEVRKDAGKAVEGKIKLKAYQGGNHVYIEVSDDGGGINRHKVIESAITKGLITKDDSRSLSNKEVYDLLFMPGFSTASEISNISGRGVGLDVAKSTIESLGGSLSIHSQQGFGTKFSIELPFTLSILSVLLIEIQAETYAIPISFIIETAFINKEDTWQEGDQIVFNFRGDDVPLVSLQEILEVPGQFKQANQMQVVIVQKGAKTIGFVVDSFIGHQEVVIKSLGDYLPNVPGISGATVLGNGQLALILDCHEFI